MFAHFFYGGDKDMWEDYRKKQVLMFEKKTSLQPQSETNKQTNLSEHPDRLVVEGISQNSGFN